MRSDCSSKLTDTFLMKMNTDRLLNQNHLKKSSKKIKCDLYLIVFDQNKLSSIFRKDPIGLKRSGTPLNEARLT